MLTDSTAIDSAVIILFTVCVSPLVQNLELVRGQGSPKTRARAQFPRRQGRGNLRPEMGSAHLVQTNARNTKAVLFQTRLLVQVRLVCNEARLRSPTLKNSLQELPEVGYRCAVLGLANLPGRLRRRVALSHHRSIHRLLQYRFRFLDRKS